MCSRAEGTRYTRELPWTLVLVVRYSRAGRRRSLMKLFDLPSGLERSGTSRFRVPTMQLHCTNARA